MDNKECKFDVLFDNMAEGVALHKYVRDKGNTIINYIIEDVNPAFEKILGIKRKNAIGKLATEIYQSSEPPYLEKYINLKQGEHRNFEVFFEPMQKYFHISVSNWEKDGFATIFFDITAQKEIETELREKNASLKKMNKIMTDRELRMIELKNEIKKNNK